MQAPGGRCRSFRRRRPTSRAGGRGACGRRGRGGGSREGPGFHGSNPCMEKAHCVEIVSCSCYWHSDVDWEEKQHCVNHQCKETRQETKDKGKMAKNSEAAALSCHFAECGAVGKAMQGSQVELKMPKTCKHGRQALAPVAEEQYSRCSTSPTWIRAGGCSASSSAPAQGKADLHHMCHGGLGSGMGGLKSGCSLGQVSAVRMARPLWHPASTDTPACLPICLSSISSFDVLDCTRGLGDGTHVTGIESAHIAYNTSTAPNPASRWRTHTFGFVITRTGKRQLSKSRSTARGAS
jgi:hypothetical protein